ncbi:MAG: PEGA domain-containing protein [Nannocystaceae bacterium]|nr:PEGA domain-containing protein [Nannocystaceae bacterium]
MVVGWMGCLGIVAVTSSAPQPPPNRTVAILPLTVEGDLGEASRDKLEEGIALGLARGNFDVIPPSRLSQEVVSSPPCKDPACFAGRAATLDADYLVQATVLDEDNRNYAVVLNLIDGRTGRVAARSEERCDVCGQQELRTLVEDQGAAMRRKLEDLVNGPPVILASSVPSGALVSIDGELIGRTPVRRELSEGEHTARLELEGYVPQERVFLAVKGLEETLAFELQQTPKKRRRLRPWGWAGLALGVPTLAAGATFLVLDGRAAPGDRCSGGNVDPLGNCKFRYNTLTPGLVLTVTGAVLTAAAVAIVIRTRKRRHTRAAARTARMFARLPGAARP